MEALFRFVLEQFTAIYQVPQPLDIHYGINQSSRIQIKPTASSFFENQLPLPPAAPHYYKWLDKEIPFWFENSFYAEPVFFTADKAIIQVDIIVGCFYFLSGWQEYYSTERDRYGRFPYAASLQYKYNLVTLPIVNYYFDILKTTIERVYNIRLKSVFARDAPFTSCLTHDIDNCESAWRVEGLQALKLGQWKTVGNLLQQKFTGHDNWANVPDVMRAVQAYEARSTFFFLANNKKFKGIANADYNITQARYQNWIDILQENQFEVAVHGSHYTATQSNKLIEETSHINTSVQGNRFHYLRFDPQLSPIVLDQAGIAYDSTLGFSEHFGFRHGTCFPFRLFNFKTNQAYTFQEIPLHLMDATLHHPRYLQLPANEILPANKYARVGNNAVLNTLPFNYTHAVCLIA